MASYDVTSLFTNVPVMETINIILEQIYSTNVTKFHGFNKQQFKDLLNLAVLDNYFIFNGTLYQQLDGMAMGSPLGPTFANILVSFRIGNVK